MWTVIASREGLAGGRTADGTIIDRDKRPLTKDDFGCALPARAALGRIVRIRYRAQEVTCPVLDLGPWFPWRGPDGQWIDDAYWLGGALAKPMAERLRGQVRPGDARALRMNGAGIDLLDGVILAFGVQPDHWGLVAVTWEWVTPTAKAA